MDEAYEKGLIVKEKPLKYSKGGTKGNRNALPVAGLMAKYTRRAYTSGCSEPWEIAEHLDVDEQFLRAAMLCCEEKIAGKLVKLKPNHLKRY